MKTDSKTTKRPHWSCKNTETNQTERPLYPPWNWTFSDKFDKSQDSVAQARMTYILTRFAGRREPSGYRLLVDPVPAREQSSAEVLPSARREFQSTLQTMTTKNSFSNVAILREYRKVLKYISTKLILHVKIVWRPWKHCAMRNQPPRSAVILQQLRLLLYTYTPDTPCSRQSCSSFGFTTFYSLRSQFTVPICSHFNNLRKIYTNLKANATNWISRMSIISLLC